MPKFVLSIKSVNQCITIGVTSFYRIWGTGAAQDLIIDAKALGADAFITGEVSERTVHLARELGIHFYAAGHHATETFGVKSLAQLLNKTFNIHCEFVDTPNPV